MPVIDKFDRQVIAPYQSTAVDCEGLLAAGEAGERTGILLHFAKLSLTPGRFAATIGESGSHLVQPGGGRGRKG